MAAADTFKAFKTMLTAPAEDQYDITPNDAVDLPKVTRGIYVGTSGNLKFTSAKGTTTTYYNLAAGVQHSMRVSRVWSTGTTAANIVGVY